MNEKSGNYWYTDEWKSKKYWYTDSLKIRVYWYNHDEWKIREVVSTETLINEKSGKYWYIDSLKIREVLIYIFMNKKSGQYDTFKNEMLESIGAFMDI